MPARERGATSSVATTLIEARLLAGPEQLFAGDAPRARPGPRLADARSSSKPRSPSRPARHHRYHDTAYNLEPNVKAGPGGLRDIQTIGWVAKRHFGADTLDELVDARLPDRERAAQAASRRRRSCGRCASALHVLTGRREDRLLFDHQIRLAQMFGYEDATYTLAVEQFMQRYYRTVMDVSLLNEMLLQLFREAILTDTNAPPVPLNARFQIRNDYLEVTDDDVFARTPSALLELFRGAAAEPASCAACARRPSARVDAAPVADRRGVPPEPAQPPAVPRDPARAGRRHARAARA